MGVSSQVTEKVGVNVLKRFKQIERCSTKTVQNYSTINRHQKSWCECTSLTKKFNKIQKAKTAHNHYTLFNTSLMENQYGSNTCKNNAHKTGLRTNWCTFCLVLVQYLSFIFKSNSLRLSKIYSNFLRSMQCLDDGIWCLGVTI